MALKERLMEDLKSAMKAKDQVEKNTISFARAAIKQIEVDTRKELSDDEIIPILAKQVKMRKDALADFEKGGRHDLIESYKKEIEILQRYLPEELSDEAIAEIVETTASELNIAKDRSNMGKLMGPVMQKVKGQADGSKVKDAVVKYLNS